MWRAAGRLYLVLMAVFIVAPLAVVVAVAFSSASFVSFPPPGWSLRWLTKVLNDPSFIRPLWNSVVLGLAAAFCAALLATPAALALARLRFRGAAEVQSFLLAPLSLPPLILSIALLFYLSRFGLADSFAGLLVGHVVITVPYLMRTVLAVYKGANPEIEEAAYVLGAGPVRAFFHVTLPAIRPGLVAGGLFAFLISFDEVAIALLLSTTSTMTLPVAILNHVAHNYDPAVAAISLIKMTLVIAVLLVCEWLFGLDRLMLTRERRA
jgi:putative spermidine/putrescine transport system permease protein